MRKPDTKRAIATVCMPGSLADKLAAAAEAGFDGIELFENDPTYFDGRPEDVRDSPARSGSRSSPCSPSGISRDCRSRRAPRRSIAPGASSS